MSNRTTTADLPAAPQAVEALPLAAQTSGEVLSQLQAARTFPRNVDTFRRNAMAWACVDADTAASCFYAVPRDGKTIEGPSIRMAEIAAIAWGNLRVRTRLVARDAKSVTVEAEVWDLETNAAFSASETGRITKRDGSTYSEDMVQTTIRATAAKARRNAILSVIPGAFLRPVLAQARKTAVGDAATLADTRARALEALQKMGVTQARVLARLGKDSVQLIDLDDILFLRSEFQRIRDGEALVDEAFPEPEKPKEPTVVDPFMAGVPAQAPSGVAVAAGVVASGGSATSPRGELQKRWTRLLLEHPDEAAKAAGDERKRPLAEISDDVLQAWCVATEAAAAEKPTRRRSVKDNPQA